MTKEEFDKFMEMGMMPTFTGSSNTIYTGSKGAGILQQIQQSNTATYSSPQTKTAKPKKKKTKAQLMKEDKFLQPIPVYPDVRTIRYKRDKESYIRMTAVVPVKGEDKKTYYTKVESDSRIYATGYKNTIPGIKRRDKIDRTLHITEQFHAECFRTGTKVLTDHDLTLRTLYDSSTYREDHTSFSREQGITYDEPGDGYTWHNMNTKGIHVQNPSHTASLIPSVI